MAFKIDRALRLLVLPALALSAACDNPVNRDDDHHMDHTVVGAEVTDLAGAVIATYTDGAWTFSSGDAIHLHPGEEKEVRIYFVDSTGDRFQLPHSGAEHTLGVDVKNQDIAAYDGHGDHGHFIGIAEGETFAELQVRHGAHADFFTNPGLPLEVVDHAH